ncbi:MobC family plasmid mobilization relaxosome protein [Roseomonas populi]|uniref:MobC family plasmid mobilization relaxosome protein n=1 Tax=Roseomonas populi TaxID=3121582 RepID=A0ABT1X377_9PROT|nr:MobC family plasmid mobilization relaxosome protein [Roseomonas pecuniae]MCR0981858.1 MobC family plasmid mobilization relaxosome protein [Roseomonas pecuniae]
METFSAAAAAPGNPRSKRQSPFSIRLTPNERARLAVEAAGAPLGSYIKAKILGDGVPVRLRRSGLPVEDRKALGQVLAALGSSRIASNLNQLAHLAHIGALPVSPEIEEELREAVQYLRDLRRLLMAALGLKPEGAP